MAHENIINENWGFGRNVNNVMNATQQQLVAHGIQKLKLASPGVDIDVNFIHMENFVKSLVNQEQEKTLPYRFKSLTQKERTGSSELQNAWRAVQGSREQENYSRCIKNDAEMKELVALVWNKIQTHQVVSEKELMEDNLIRNIAEMVEEKPLTHLVCGVGMRVRILKTLQGYSDLVDNLDVMTSQQLANELGSELSRQVEKKESEKSDNDPTKNKNRNPILEEIGQFRKDAFKRVSKRYRGQMNINEIFAKFDQLAKDMDWQ